MVAFHQPRCVGSSLWLAMVVALLAVSMPSGHVWAQEPPRERSRLSLGNINWLLASTKDADDIAIVRFETEFGKGFRVTDDGKNVPVLIPNTGIRLDSERRWGVHVDGAFTAVKVVRGAVPELGRVETTVPRESQRATDSVLRRLHTLLPEGGSIKPILVVGVWPKGAKSALDGTFLGPITASEMKEIVEFGDVLAAQPPSKMTQKEAEALLDSPNPWKVCLALLRLEALKEITAGHFTRAAKSLPLEHADSIITFLLGTSLGNETVSKDLTKELTTFFHDTAPQRQLELLKSLNKYAKKLLRPRELAQLRTAAQEYRQKILNDPKRRDVLRVLDAFLEPPKK